MKTCLIMQCGDRPRCHLERDGIEDLCPQLKQIREEAISKTLKAWRAQERLGEIIPLERFEGERKTITINFSLQVAFWHMQNYEASRKKKTLDLAAFEKKWDVRIIDPGPEPKAWIPERENDYERNVIQGLTDVDDRAVYLPVSNPEKALKAMIKNSKIITKQEERERRDRRESERIHQIQEDRFHKMLEMLEAM